MKNRTVFKFVTVVMGFVCVATIAGLAIADKLAKALGQRLVDQFCESGEAQVHRPAMDVLGAEVLLATAARNAFGLSLPEAWAHADVRDTLDFGLELKREEKTAQNKAYSASVVRKLASALPPPSNVTCGETMTNAKLFSNVLGPTARVMAATRLELGGGLNKVAHDYARALEADEDSADSPRCRQIAETIAEDGEWRWGVTADSGIAYEHCRFWLRRALGPKEARRALERALFKAMSSGYDPFFSQGHRAAIGRVLSGQ